MKAKGLKNESRSRKKTTAPIDASPKIDKRTREKIIKRDAERIASLAAVMFQKDDYSLDVCVERAERILELSYQAARKMHSTSVSDRVLTFSEYAMRVCSDANVTRARAKLMSAWICREIAQKMSFVVAYPGEYEQFRGVEIADKFWHEAEAEALRKTENGYRESWVAKAQADYKATKVCGRDDPYWDRLANDFRNASLPIDAKKFLHRHS